jgi:hypothetical protein
VSKSRHYSRKSSGVEENAQDIADDKNNMKSSNNNEIVHMNKRATRSHQEEKTSDMGYNVNHHVLLTKLEFYGITGNLYKLYKSYLMNPYQRTLLYSDNGNIIKSAWTKGKQGVLQGSVLGPLLFLIYINDLPKFVNGKSSPILFVDDTSILVSHSNPVEFCNTINTVFQTLSDWFRYNLLCVWNFCNLKSCVMDDHEGSIVYFIRLHRVCKR